MSGYLGETIVDLSKSKYNKCTKADWVLLWVEMYSSVDGSHHKDWLLDQIARIIKGANVSLKVASWDDGTTNERFSLEEPPPEYWEWVKEMKAGEDGPDTYSYDFGVAP